ncbi:MAG TPA: GspMb/PilO family protein [Candidatus Angelobacter sp.]|nr:GspMb/PilO family protein [Candidatus Angelobacter sp.]
MNKELSVTRKRYISILAILGILDLVLIGYLLLPGSSASAMADRESSLRNQADAMEREMRPLRGIAAKLDGTRVDVKKFYEQNVPSQFSQISQHLEKLMQENGVTTTQGIHYVEEKSTEREDKADLPDIRRFAIDTTVTGEYAKVARFINALEQDKLVFIIDQISLSSAEGGAVTLQIKCDTFLRQAS